MFFFEKKKFNLWLNYFNKRNQLKLKIEKKENFFVIENWNTANEQSKLKNLRDLYNNYREEGDALGQQAMELKESRQDGAYNSINQSYETTQNASNALESAMSKVESELKPLLDSLKNKLKESEEDFEELNQRLEEFFKKSSNEFSEYSTLLSQINEKVCGEETSLEKMCSEKCGGSGCENRCGSGDQLVCKDKGLVDTAVHFINERKKFEDAYAKKELLLKKVLTKVKNFTQKTKLKIF